MSFSCFLVAKATYRIAHGAIYRMPWAYIDHRQVNIDEKIIDMLSLGSSSIYFRYAQIRYLDVAFGKPNRYISFGNVSCCESNISNCAWRNISNAVGIYRSPSGEYRRENYRYVLARLELDIFSLRSNSIFGRCLWQAQSIYFLRKCFFALQNITNYLYRSQMAEFRLRSS